MVLLIVLFSVVLFLVLLLLRGLEVTVGEVVIVVKKELVALVLDERVRFS